MPLTFNPAPGWPVPPPDWFPGKDWSPDPAWPGMPPGWRLVMLAGEPSVTASYGVNQVKSPAVLAISVPQPVQKIDTRKKVRDVVTSGDVAYDRGLLPDGFSDRGLTDADQAWWDDRFDDALADRDQPLLQALVQGEVDRVTDSVAALNARMKAMDHTSLLRARSSMIREADAAQRLLGHVMERSAPLRK